MSLKFNLSLLNLTLTFSSIQQHFIRDIQAKFGIPNSSQCPDFGKTPMGVFPISGFLVNPLENCHNSRDSDNIDIKLGAVTKLYSRNKATSKIFDDDVMLVNDEVIVVFLTYSQF